MGCAAMNRRWLLASTAICPLGLCIGLCTMSAQAAKKESIEFVAEHLPEVAMDNRYATLPIWGVTFQETNAGAWFGQNGVAAQAGFSSTSAGNLTIEGPLLSAAMRWELGDRWNLTGFLFYDDLQLTAQSEQRPLQTLFAPTDPLSRPAESLFTGLDGTATGYGAGLSLTLHSSRGWLGEHRWVTGLLWQEMKLQDYRLDYTVLEGASTGASGQIDFDATYSFVTPFVGLELPRRFNDWTFSPHVLFALPLPKQGMIGHITGPGFDIHGDTADVGEGKHVGDASLTLGLDLTYEPLHLSVDAGATLTQWLLDPAIHTGVDQNLVISVQWRY